MIRIKNRWRNFSKGQKILIVIFVSLFFLNSNISAINRGICSSSPCGGESNRFAQKNHPSNSYTSTYLHTSSNVIFSPTSLFLLLLPYDREVFYFPPHHLSIGLDDDTITERKQDENWARLMYIVTKLLILLSLPLWIFASFWIVGRHERIVFFSILFLITSLISILAVWSISTHGISTHTWDVLFFR